MGAGPCDDEFPLGIMQGRLTPPEAGRFQSFPRQRWRDEFPRARQAGLSYIEWIHDEYGRTANPIFSAHGLDEIASLRESYGIATPALCGDWFMDFPLIRCTAAERETRESHLLALIPVVHRMGATRLILPFVDNSRMMNQDEQQTVKEILLRALPVAEHDLVELHIEADLDPGAFADFLARIEHPLLKVNWDAGNSSGLGYLAGEEFAAYGNRIGSIHLKDRYRKPQGGVETRPLGKGSADFPEVFRAIRSIDYAGGLTLQVARGADEEELAFIREQAAFVRDQLSCQRSL